ncbi:GEVED domain-containing protein [Photobacterium leiognathi]|uniref:GEVED domain-containing protein n=1 Tax=Photobacterium leiognathi TaxID=553611 RepID=UPI002980C640|nr:GEVED domain-containing protein [Photobacterium leiognathi]
MMRCIMRVVTTVVFSLFLSFPISKYVVAAEGVGLVYQSTLVDIGGNGGGEFAEKLCPAGQLMTGFDFYNQDTGGNLDGIALRGRCSQITVVNNIATLTEVGVTGWGGGSVPNGNLYTGSCPANQAVVGVDADTTTWPVMGWFRLYCAPVTYNQVSKRLEIAAAPASPSTGKIGPDRNYPGTYYNRIVAPAGQALAGFNGRQGAALDKVRFRAYSFVQANITLNAVVQTGSALASDFALIATDTSNIAVNFTSGDSKAMTPSNYTFTWTGPADYELVSFSCANPLTVTNGNNYNCTYVFRSTKVDYGDAPSSYGGLQAGANGGDNANIYLGAVPPDHEGNRFTDGVDNMSNATEDDNEGITPDDEDALNAGLVLVNSNANAAAYSLTIPCNDFDGTDLGASVYGWIDTDRNGTFDGDEFTSAICNDNSTGLDGSALLTWNGLDITTNSGMSYVRLRITTDAIGALDANTDVSDGEVEDHQFEIINQIVLSGKIFNDNGGTYTGIAHNGVIENGENGVANFTIQVIFNDTGVAGVTTGDTIATTVSAGSGDYQFTLPVKYTNKKLLLKVVAQSPWVDISEQDDSSITQLTNLDVTDNEMAIIAQAGDNVENLNFGKVKAPTFSANYSEVMKTASTLLLSHRLTTYTAGSVRITLENETTSPNNPDWNVMLYEDRDCDAELDPEDTPISNPYISSANSQICVISKIFSPSAISVDSMLDYFVRADMTFADSANLNHGVTKVLNNNDTISVLSTDSGHLKLTKTVRNVTQGTPEGIRNVANPGDILEYRIRFTNTGTGAIKDMVLHDSTPDFTVIQQVVACDASLLPTSLSCNVATPNGSNNIGYRGDILWSLNGALLGGESGLVVYRVKINN